MKQHPNQVSAGSKIYEHFVNNKEGVSLFAQCQSGKTGAVIHALELIARHPEHQSSFFFMGPSSKELLKQNTERLKQNPYVYTSLVRGECYHAPNIYPSSKDLEDIKVYISSCLKVGKRVVVVLDEAHIGIGKNKQDELQTVPAFFEEVLESLPLLDQNPNVFFILVTATPFTYDYHYDKNPDFKRKFPEVYLEPGPGYYGLSEHYDAGGLTQSFDFKSKPASSKYPRFQNHFESILRNYLDENRKGYFVARATTAPIRARIRKACNRLGIPHQEFTSKNNNIAQFDIELRKIPGTFAVKVIDRAYGAGKTIDTSNIVGWYEANTCSGRHDAAETQSMGRNWGYGKSNKYPIWCNLEGSAKKMIDYYQLAADQRFSEKNQVLASTTHTRVKKKRNTEATIIFVGSTPDEVRSKYFAANPRDKGRGFTMRNVSSSNSDDLAKYVFQGNISSGAEGDHFRITCIDGPNSNYQESFDNLLNKFPDLDGKYVIVARDSSSPQWVGTRKDSSYLSENIH